jgi:DNA-binding response OmpR family regulator
MEETKRLFLPIRFGIFEVDLQAGELRKQGYKVKLQEQPFQVLALLLEPPARSWRGKNSKNSFGWPTLSSTSNAV